MLIKPVGMETSIECLKNILIKKPKFAFSDGAYVSTTYVGSLAFYKLEHSAV